jgi:hypothetical protein
MVASRRERERWMAAADAMSSSMSAGVTGWPLNPSGYSSGMKLVDSLPELNRSFSITERRNGTLWFTP